MEERDRGFCDLLRRYHNQERGASPWEEGLKLLRRISAGLNQLERSLGGSCIDHHWRTHAWGPCGLQTNIGWPSFKHALIFNFSCYFFWYMQGDLSKGFRCMDIIVIFCLKFFKIRFRCASVSYHYGLHAQKFVVDHSVYLRCMAVTLKDRWYEKSIKEANVSKNQ